ncbi:MAG: nitroreductase family protein, partial [Anaerolineaceae bacterium]|nr:nitroreductase family protein [Anaerolineaceae bacterium]
MTSLLETIKTRKSIRTFDGRPLSQEDLGKLEQYISGITNPFDIPVDFVLLDAGKFHLSSPVLTGEKLYIAGKVRKGPYADVAFGYSFEKMVLFAWSLGIGTVWIGGTMKREAFENAAGLTDGEMMPCISPLGYPAPKFSLKETLMRTGVRADSRIPAEKIFFENSFDTPLSPEKKAELGDLIEMVRWAPSAVNKQPW